MGKSEERDFGENSPALVDGSFPVLGSGKGLNPMDTGSWFAGEKSAPSHHWDSYCPILAQSSSCPAPGGDNSGQLGLGQHNRAGANREGKRFVYPFLAVSMVKRCCHESLQILI